MNPSRTIVASLLLTASIAGLSLSACSSADSARTPAAATENESVDDRASTSSSTAEVDPAAVAAPDMDALRGLRYCEVLLLRHDDGFTAEVWTTMGMSDCPDDQWKVLDAPTLAAERGAVLALLNGPRYWTLDSIRTDLRAGAPETMFGQIAMFRAATIELGDQMPTQTPYTERPIGRDTVFGFDAGTPVYELISADGTTYVMQARSQIVDGTLDEEGLATLGERLALPAGWTYRVRTIDEALELSSTDGIAVVVQDELQNTYQRVDP
jgi:hypothetical protein